MNKLSEKVTSVPVAGHSRKIEATAHLRKNAVKIANTTAVST